MNLKKIVTACLLFVISITMCKSALPQTDLAAGDLLSVPYFTEKKIRFYKTSDASLYYTFNLAPEFVNFPIPFASPGVGPNATAIYDGKIFISFDSDTNPGQGGVLIYNYYDIYPVRNSNPPVIISTAPVAGIAIHPTNGDLYVAKFNDGTNSGMITSYTHASGYSAGSAYNLPIPNWWVNYFTGIAFDMLGNLWTGNLDEHCLVCFTYNSGFENFYVIGNGAITNLYPAATLTGGSVNVHLFSAPEGFALDNSNNLWFSNNNDWIRANNPGEGTFGKLSPAYIAGLFGQPVSGTRANPIVANIYTVPLYSVNVYYRQDAKFGGMVFNWLHTLYMNDQGNLKIWKWDITTAYDNTNFTQDGSINTTYPGFGGLSFNDVYFNLIGITTLGKNIPESFSLKQNYPNPFNPSTNIRYDLPKNGFVKLVVFDALGREVETLVNENQPAGTYEATFNASVYSSGVYFYRLTTDYFCNTKKMLLIK